LIHARHIGAKDRVTYSGEAGHSAPTPYPLG
jgi:hypothetical protein